MNTNDKLSEEILLLEEMLLSPEVRSSRSRLQELLAEEFVEFGSSGRVFDRTTVIDSLTKSESKTQYLVEHFKLRRLAADTVLVTYEVEARSDSGTVLRRSLRSSIWTSRDGQWQMVFHQGTLKHKRA